MTARVFLHVGPFKTGTTFLQQVLTANQAVLAEQGVCLPGGTSRFQAAAAASALGMPDPSPPGEQRVGWDDLAARVHAWDGPTAVVSAEFLCRARPRQVARMVQALRPAEVHVVFMARDLARVVPAMWQTTLRTGVAEPWATYLASVRGDARSGPAGRRFWHSHDARQVLHRWGTKVPAERIHVVTVPPSGTDPAVLWGRFAGVVGLDPASCSLQVRRSNPSLGCVEAEVLRRLNGALDGRLSLAAYKRWVKRFVSYDVLERRSDQRRFALPESELTWLRPRAEQIVAFLDRAGYDVVGDLRDVLPVPGRAEVPPPDAVEQAEVLDAAVDVLAELLVRLDAQRGAAGGPRRRGLRQPATPAAPKPRLWLSGRAARDAVLQP
jgi:hypothetical protein